MAQITAAAVKELRDATNISMMECKKALEEAQGDKDAAIKLLRERGMAIAGKKASRATNEGVIAASASPDGRTAALLELNCETDFVARNDSFKAFVADLVRRALDTDTPLADSAADELKQKISEIGENLVIRRNLRFICQSPGLVMTYIHLGGKVGVIVEVGCGKSETAAQPALAALARDITLQIAASSPRFLVPEEVPAGLLQSEREIYARQVADKPAQIVDKIVEGKLRKFYTEVCLTKQPFVKDPEVTIEKLVAAKGKELGDELVIRRFARFQVGD